MLPMGSAALKKHNGTFSAKDLQSSCIPRQPMWFIGSLELPHKDFKQRMNVILSTTFSRTAGLVFKPPAPGNSLSVVGNTLGQQVAPLLRELRPGVQGCRIIQSVFYDPLDCNAMINTFKTGAHSSDPLKGSRGACKGPMGFPRI